MRFYNRQHRHYCGIDLHVKTMYICILDSAGQARPSQRTVDSSGVAREGGGVPRRPRRRGRVHVRRPRTHYCARGEAPRCRRVSPSAIGTRDRKGPDADRSLRDSRHDPLRSRAGVRVLRAPREVPETIRRENHVRILAIAHDRANPDTGRPVSGSGPLRFDSSAQRLRFSRGGS